MKTPAFRALAVSVIGLGLATAAFAGGFVRPIIGIADPSTDGYSSATTAGLCAGYYWNSETSSISKEASLEIGYTKWTYRGDVDGYGVRAKEEYLPVLLNLRAHFPLGKELERVRFYFGPSLGLAQARGTVKVSDDEDTYSASVSDWSFCYGGTAGFVFQLTDKVDLDVGFRLLRLEGSDFDVEGYQLETEASTTKIWYAGLGYRF